MNNNNAMNKNTMNKNTANNNDNDNESTINSFDNSCGIPIADAVLSTPAQLQHQPGTSSALYKLAARNLREYHGVPSMTALNLEKTVALLGLRPRRVVAQGLAPQRLLKNDSSPLVLARESSDEGQEELLEAETGALMYASGDNLNDSSNNSRSEDIQEEEDFLFSDDSNSTYNDNGDCIDNKSDNGGDDTKGDVEGFNADGSGNGKKKRPIHAALVAGGINLRPRETKPLLRALGVSPHRLVKLGLVKHGPGKRDVGRPHVGGPRGPPHGPPHAHRCCGHTAGHHRMHLVGSESKEEGIPAPLGPGHRGPRHHGGRLQGPPHGPGHHSMTTGMHGSGKHGHGHRHHPHGHGHGHYGRGLRSESEGEEGGRMDRGAGGPGQHGPRRHGGGMGGPRGPPCAPPHAHHCCEPVPGGGSSRPTHGPGLHPFLGTGHHAMHPGEESEEEGMSAPLGLHGRPEHRGPRHHGGRLEGPPHHLTGPVTAVWLSRGPPGGGKHGHGHGHPPYRHEHVYGHGHYSGGGLHSESEGDRRERLHGGGAGGAGRHGPRCRGGGMGGPRRPRLGPPHGPPRAHDGPSSGGGPICHHTLHLGGENEEEDMSAPLNSHAGPRHRGPLGLGGRMGRSRGRPHGPPHAPAHGPFHGLFHESTSGGPPGMMAHPHLGLPSRGCGGMQQRGSRRGGGTWFCGGGGGGGCNMQRRRRAHPAQFHGGRHQPQLEAC